LVVQFRKEKTVKALVIYDSVFGNTEQVARAIGAALGSSPEVEVFKVDAVKPEQLEGLESLFVGSPTRGFRATPALMEFLAALPDDCLKGVKAAAFDTRIPMETIKNRFFRFIVSRGGYADKPISIELIRLGAQQPVPTAGFFVLESEGPLQEGELERAALWAQNI
jgi:flavodoxin